MHIAVTVHMRASADEIWDLVSDVTKIGRYSPETFEAEWIDGATGPAVGAMFRGHVKRNGIGPTYWTRCTVTASEPGKEFAFGVLPRPGRPPLSVWGYHLESVGDGTDVTENDYDYVMDTNTRGAFFVAQEVGKRMLARSRGAAPGTFIGGRIVNVASMAGLRVLSQIGVYAMSKAAVVHMTRAMALEWGKYGINVNALCPGYIDTEINHHHWDTEQGRKLVELLPRKRVGQPKDLDTSLLMLCANESHFINGAVIQVDDGFGV